MPKASPILASFNGGEYSPLMEGRTDYAKYPKGLRKMINFLPTTQGPAVRRAGTRFVAEVKDSADRTWLVKFQFSVTQAYALEFGDGYIRFYTNHGQVINGAVPYEIASPYAAADLTNADGTLALHFTQSADVLYLFHAKYPPQVLTRHGALDWTIAPIEFKGGPFDDQNLVKGALISINSAGTGAVSNFDWFSPSMVGTLMYLESKDFSAVTPWQPGKVLVTEGGNPFGTLRRVDQRVYRCVTDHTVPSGDLPLISGTQTPTHTSGVAWDGDGNPIASVASWAGVQWEFMHPGYAVFKITGYTDARHISVTLQSEWTVPADYTSDDPANGTWRWRFSRWDSSKGWPDLVTFFRSRLTCARSADQAIDFSVVSDYLNFQNTEFGQVTADMAISATVAADQEFNSLSWLLTGDQLLIGGAGAEFVCAEQTANDVFGPDNIKISRQTGYGSRGIDAISTGSAALYVQRGGLQLMEIQFSIQTNAFDSDDKSLQAEHLMVGGLTQMAFQKETDTLLWAVRGDGLLLAYAYNPKQDVYAWAQVPIGGNGIVESIMVMPAPTLDRYELWLIVRRTINGQTKRYVEFMERPWRKGDTQPSAFYVDCGLTYTGESATVISGLDHLEGQTVDVLADGAVQPQLVVSGGAVTLKYAATVANIGLPCPCRMVTERLDAGSADGTSQGKTKRINRLVFRFLNSLGGKFGPEDGPYDDILTRSGNDLMDNALPFFTGDTEQLEFPDGYNFDGIVDYVNDQPVPVTVVAIMPQLNTQD